MPSKYETLVDVAIEALEAGKDVSSFSVICGYGNLDKHTAIKHYHSVDRFWDAVDRKLRETDRKLIRQDIKIIHLSDELLYTKIKKLIATGGPYDDRIEEARRLLFGVCMVCRKAATNDKNLCLNHMYYKGK